MASNFAAMAHDDIWDDSALVRSWDDALAEYKVRFDSPETQHVKPELTILRNITVSTPVKGLLRGELKLVAQAHPNHATAFPNNGTHDSRLVAAVRMPRLKRLRPAKKQSRRQRVRQGHPPPLTDPKRVHVSNPPLHVR